MSTAANRHDPASDRFLRAVADPVRAEQAPGSTPAFVLPAVVLLAGAIYGAAMGSWGALQPDRWLMILYAAIKVPLLIAATTAICLPGYFVIVSVLGLRDTFRPSLRAIAAGQAAMTLTLAALAPLTLLVYFSRVDHAWALLFNAAMFTVATAVASIVMLRRFAPLIALRRQHRLTLGAWVIMYVFVGVQAGWMMRPFVGSPGLPVAFFRDEPFSNAYVAVARIAARAAGTLLPDSGREPRPYR